MFFSRFSLREIKLRVQLFLIFFRKRSKLNLRWSISLIEFLLNFFDFLSLFLYKRILLILNFIPLIDFFFILLEFLSKSSIWMYNISFLSDVVQSVKITHRFFSYQICYYTACTSRNSSITT